MIAAPWFARDLDAFVRAWRWATGGLGGRPLASIGRQDGPERGRLGIAIELPSRTMTR